MSSAEVAKNGPEFDVFCAPNLVDGPLKVLEAVVNRHHFRPSGQVWLRSHGWSFIYADEIKKEKINRPK